MNESILNALLQLFAIIANVSKDGVSFKARNIVKSYLSHHLNAKLINKYLKLFNQYIQDHHPEIFNKETKGAEKTISSSKEVLQIGEEINRNLLQREKFIVFLRLVEFINEDEIMTQKELDFIKTVADSFNIDESSHNNTKAFVLNPFSPDIEKDKILVIDDKPEPADPDVKHISKNNLDGRIVVLWHATTNTYVFRYSGKSNLYLNGHNIFPGRIGLIEQGAMITGRKITPIYYSDISRKFHHSETAAKIYFTAENIEFRFKGSTKGIKKFNFAKESGNLIGIMGGSGVGKSTLLNILSGKLIPQNGRILINGIDIHKNKEKLEGMIGFVPQDDLLIEDLTVFQNLYYNARLCFSNLSEKKIIEKVIKILIDLELDDIKHLKVGNPLRKIISGGQRKRLNIALELIREPLILFADEPTSGLSSMDSEKVMFLLKEQTIKGKLVIVNIHQPFSDIFKLFDRILILDKGGYTIFKGNPINALIYFKSLSDYVNAEESQCLYCGNVIPEEILRIVEAREVDEYGKLTRERKVLPEEWYKNYLEKIEAKTPVKPKKEKLPEIFFKIPNPFVQFKIFSVRNIISKLANRQYLLVTFLEAPLLAAIIGFFTKYISDLSSTGSYIFRENENLPAYLFIAVIVALFMGLMVSAEEIICDRKILERESFLNLSRLSYLYSKIIILFAISAIQTFTFVIVGNAILEIKGMTFAYWFILFTTSCMANMIGLNLSSGLNSVKTIYIIIPFFLVPQLLFSGVIVNFDRLHKFIRHPVYVPFIGDVMTSRWAYEALAVHQFKNNKFQKTFFAFEKEKSNASYQTALLIPKLQIKVQESIRNIKLGQNQKRTEQNLELLSNEIRSSQINYNWPLFYQINKLTLNSFDTTVARNTLSYLAGLKAYTINKQNEASRQIDNIFEEFFNRTGGKNAIIKLQTDYFNDKLAEQVTNRNIIKKIIELDNHFIRKKDPIYMEPSSNYGRAHFYAPFKKLGNLSIDTFWFNTLVILLTSFILFITLAFDVLRKIIVWFENVKLKR